MIFIDNKYTLMYYRIINRAKNRTLTAGFESHHIIPESFFISRKRKGSPGWLIGNPDATENIVRLTGREHCICHRLLIKMCENIGRSKMVYAFLLMRAINKKTPN